MRKVILLALVNSALAVCTRFSSFNSNDDRPLPINGQVTFTCQVNTSVLFWTSSLFTEQTIVSGTVDGPLLINAPDVTANRLISVEDDCLTSQIMLTGPLQQANGAFVVCEDDDNPRNVIGNITINTAIVSSSPQSLINISQTYESVLLNWTEPTDDGGRPIQYYFINVTGGPSDCTNGICITTSTSYNVTGLMFGVQYTFTVSANNSVGMSAPSDELLIQIPNAVPDPVSDIMYCISRTSDNDQILLQWTCPVSLTDPSITPPITHYTAVMMGNTLLCPLVEESSCSSSTDYCPIDVSDGQMITADITAVNPVGNSTARSVSINITLALLSITVINVTSDSVAIQCSTSYQSSANRYCYITITSPAVISGHSMFDGTDSVNVTFNNLMSGTTYMFTASLVNDSNQPFPSVCITIVDSFTVESIMPIEPSSSSSMLISVASTAIYTASSNVNTQPTSTCSPSIIESQVTAAVAISIPVTAVVTALISVIATFIMTYYCIRFKRNASYSTTAGAAALYETPVSSANVVEMKSNAAYGHVTTGSGVSPAVVYDTVNN